MNTNYSVSSLLTLVVVALLFHTDVLLNRIASAPKNDSISSIHFPIQSSRPPPSSASTESTLVVDAGRLQLGHNLKRPREEPDAIAEEDMPKVVRPRTEFYPERPDSILGWFMMPFHSFVRGFKEGLMDQS